MTFFGAVIFASFMLTSCSQEPTEIKLSDLDTACDYQDAIEKCLDAIIEIKDDNNINTALSSSNVSELPEEQQEIMRQLESKWMEIELAAKKKFTTAEMEECPNFEKFLEKYKTV